MHVQAKYSVPDISHNDNRPAITHGDYGGVKYGVLVTQSATSRTMLPGGQHSTFDLAIFMVAVEGAGGKLVVSV